MTRLLQKYFQKVTSQKFLKFKILSAYRYFHYNSCQRFQFMFPFRKLLCNVENVAFKKNDTANIIPRISITS